MSKTHTPGPWHCSQPPDSPRQITDGQMRICTMTNRSQEIENARLIAAAPELLAACQRALKTIEELPPRVNEDRCEPLLQLSAAIRKATQP